MVNVFKTLISIPIFASALFVGIISVPIFTGLETAMNAMNFTALADIMWFMIFIMWIFILIGVPAYYYYIGISEKNEKSAFSNILSAGIIFIFGLALIYQGFYMVQAVLDAVEATGSNILYTISWISTIGFILAWLLGLPVALYIEAQSNQSSGEV